MVKFPGNFLLGLASCNINTTSLMEGLSAGFLLVQSSAILSSWIISSLTDMHVAPAFPSKISRMPSLFFIFDLTQSTMLLPSPNSGSTDLLPLSNSISTTP